MRQSFSHGRTKPVVVEKVKRRVLGARRGPRGQGGGACARSCARPCPGCSRSRPQTPSGRARPGAAPSRPAVPLGRARRRPAHPDGRGARRPRPRPGRRQGPRGGRTPHRRDRGARPRRARGGGARRARGRRSAQARGRDPPPADDRSPSAAPRKRPSAAWAKAARPTAPAAPANPRADRHAGRAPRPVTVTPVARPAGTPEEEEAKRIIRRPGMPTKVIMPPQARPHRARPGEEPRPPDRHHRHGRRGRAHALGRRLPPPRPAPEGLRRPGAEGKDLPRGRPARDDHHPGARQPHVRARGGRDQDADEAGRRCTRSPT